LLLTHDNQPISPRVEKHEVNKTVEILNIQSEVNDLTFSTKFIMKTVKEKIDVRDQEEWYDELFTDRGNQNGNKFEKIKSISDHHREDSLKENGFQFQHSFYYIQHKVYLGSKIISNNEL
jgi:hypothetical protein